MAATRALLDAADVGDAPSIERALRSGLSVDAQDASGDTALHKAAVCGDLAVVEALLATGATPDLVNVSRWTALGLAIHHGHIAVVRALLASGAATDRVSEAGDPAIMCAIRAGRLMMVDMLLDTTEVNMTLTTHCESALTLAVKLGLSGVVDKLLAAGVDVDYEDPDGYTALVLATRHGNESIVSSLLAHGVSQVDASAALAVAADGEQDHEGVVSLLLAGGADVEYAGPEGRSLRPLMLAARKGYKDIIEVLLHAGADVNAISSLRDSALVFAAAAGQSAVVRQLLAVDGVQIDHEDAYVGSALLCAVRCGNEEVFEMLCAAGANVHVVSYSGMTLLMCAADRGSMKIIEKLIELGLGMDRVDQRGDSALHYASRSGQAAVVEALLVASDGRHINHANWREDTALLVAARKGYAAVVEILLAWGAWIDRAGAYGRTPLLESVGNVNTLAALIVAGADADAVDEFGYSAFLRAAESGYVRVIELLLAHGVDTNRMRNGQNALELAQSYRQNEVLSLLCELYGEQLETWVR